VNLRSFFFTQRLVKEWKILSSTFADVSSVHGDWMNFRKHGQPKSTMSCLLLNLNINTTRHDTIRKSLDWKTKCGQLNLTQSHVTKNKITTPSCVELGDNLGVQLTWKVDLRHWCQVDRRVVFIFIQNVNLSVFTRVWIGGICFSLFLYFFIFYLFFLFSFSIGTT